MTSTTATTSTPSMVRPALRLTRRGRLVLLAVFVGLAAVLMIALSGLATATGERGAAEQVRTVTVQPGDTLYGLAADLAGPGEIRDTVQRIKELNAMTGSSLQVGDSIAVPVN